MESDVLQFLKELINENDRIIVYDTFSINILNDVISRIINNYKFVLLVSSIVDDRCENQIKYVPQKSIDEIKRINELYDFSNKITIISQECQYGGMLNYYKAGIISKEEMVEYLI